MKKLIYPSLMVLLFGISAQAFAGIPYKYWISTRKLDSQKEEILKEKHKIQRDSGIEDSQEFLEPDAQGHLIYSKARWRKLSGFEAQISQLRTEIDNIRDAIANLREKESYYWAWCLSSTDDRDDGPQNPCEKHRQVVDEIRGLHNVKYNLYNINVPSLVSEIVADRMHKPNFSREGTMLTYPNSEASESESLPSSRNSSRFRNSLKSSPAK